MYCVNVDVNTFTYIYIYVVINPLPKVLGAPTALSCCGAPPISCGWPIVQRCGWGRNCKQEGMNLGLHPSLLMLPCRPPICKTKESITRSAQNGICGRTRNYVVFSPWWDSKPMVIRPSVMDIEHPIWGYISIYLSVCLSIYLSVYLSIYLSIYIYSDTFTYTYICIPIYIYTYIPIYPYTYIPSYLYT